MQQWLRPLAHHASTVHRSPTARYSCLRFSSHSLAPRKPFEHAQYGSTRRNASSAPSPQSPQDAQALERRIAAIPISNFRNFCVIAHVDHGKSTLSDRLLELTGTITPGSNPQILDKLEVERTRGITVKAQTCSMLYTHRDEDYLLHLVDTPGHVDFRAEVSRSYASCGGALLLVDASQGIQAQTVANFYQAFSQGLEMVTVLNKVDLPGADVKRTLEQIENTFELDTSGTLQVSAKTGMGVKDILPTIIERVPAPSGDENAPLQMLLVDSWYDNYKGVILLVRIFQGTIRAGEKVTSFVTGRTYIVGEVGIMYPAQVAQPTLRAGQVGYIHFNPGMKKSSEAKVGDTYAHTASMSRVQQLPGFEEPKAMVYMSAYPTHTEDFAKLEDSVHELTLNDRSVTVAKESSLALGAGFRLGFLGTLHASVFEDRLRQEHGANIMITAPSVPYRVKWKDGKEEVLSAPGDFPDAPRDALKIDELAEPFVLATITVPQEYVGSVMTLCQSSRGSHKETTSFTAAQAILKYELPLAALAKNFFGLLKGATKGYATLDYEDARFQAAPLEKLQLLINREPVDAITQVVHQAESQSIAKRWAREFRELIDRQLFEIVIQVATRAGKNVLARETLRAYRKDVTAKLHAADVSRRRKLLEKQKEGRKKLRAVGNVQIEQSAFQKFLSKR
ncbi:MAG: hypothetical protein Q9162_003903 [Coniocarpon cinnabarinum]